METVFGAILRAMLSCKSLRIHKAKILLVLPVVVVVVDVVL